MYLAPARHATPTGAGCGDALKIPRAVRRRDPAATVMQFPDHMPALLRRVYANRNVSNATELDYSLSRLLPFTALKQIGQAAGLLAEAIAMAQKITIVADYDADGATACALAMRGLRSCGALQVSYLVPDRFRHGYGLGPALAEMAAAEDAQVLVTVDNGISSIEGVARARELGMQVLVTDHHLPGAQLPPADVIVNPNQPWDVFPSKSVAGVGVMFYVLAALRQCLRDRNWFSRRGLDEPNLATLIDLVALGTVADVVPLDHNNRIFVAQGLARIRARRCQPGILALLETGNRDPERVTATDLGFTVGPRLNAAGRLTDMRLGIECLLADDAQKARRMAMELDRLNRERREIQAEMQRQAVADLDQVASGDATTGSALCIYREEWHAGVVGVLASQIKERVQRPVIAFARDGDGTLKGSARSISGVHIRDALANVNAAHPGLIIRFGGHAMAAGLSLAEHNLGRFADLLEQEITARWPSADIGRDLLSDGELAAGEISLETAELLRVSGPWGQSFPEPLFDGEFQVTGARVVGDNHLKLTLASGTGNRPLDAIAFNQADGHVVECGQHVHLAYRLDVNEYKGRRSVQLLVEQLD